MKYNTCRAVLTLSGDKPLISEDKIVTFATLMFTAIMSDLAGDDKLSMDKKREIYRLKQRLALADGMTELSAEEVVMIRERAYKSLKIDLFCQIDEFLEHPSPSLTVVEEAKERIPHAEGA